MALGDKLVSLNGLQAAHSDLKNKIANLPDVDEAAREKVMPWNLLVMSEVQVGSLDTNGNLYPQTTAHNTSGFIPVKPGDTVYLTGISASDGLIWATGAMQVICEYDSAKNKLVRSTATNGYTVQSQGAAYVRLAYGVSGSFGTAKTICVTLNGRPATIAEVRPNHAPSYITAMDRIGIVKPKVIDCWGDSRTSASGEIGTAYTDYLQTLLGSGYSVTNYGYSSLASGMISTLLGSNELFVTMEDNQIAASGTTSITNIFASSGSVYNVFGYTTVDGMPCEIKGVKGKLYKAKYDDYSSCGFVRTESGSAVTVYPHTKVDVIDRKSPRHAVILWWGKNDMTTGGNAGQGRPNLINIYDDAVKYIGHDRFIILGETMSLSDLYDPTGSNPAYYNFVNTLNESLMAKYPDNFIDINAWLSSEAALTSVNLTKTSADTANFAKEWPAEQLMNHSTDSTDTVHPNAKGREAIAKKIYAFMQAKGWV